jgi:formylglycine-generating enzyme required for sulfatase activity
MQPPGEVDLRLPAPDMPSPDMLVCPSYPAGGGGGKGRPEVLVKGGRYEIEGKQFDVANFYLDVFEVTVRAYRECHEGGTGPCTKPDTGTHCIWTDVAGAKPEATCEQTSSSCSHRGGSWDGNDASRVRAALRNASSPANRIGSIGFRCARSAP